METWPGLFCFWDVHTCEDRFKICHQNLGGICKVIAFFEKLIILWASPLFFDLFLKKTGRKNRFPGGCFVDGSGFSIGSEHCFFEKAKIKSMALWSPVSRGLGLLV